MRARPWLLAAALAVAYLLIAPASSDLAAQLYRADLVERGGWTLWDNGWYGGHHTLGYSVLSPPLGALIGVRLAGALAAVAAAALFERLARRHFGAAASLGATWFALGTAAQLYSGRLTFALGLALALGALLALDLGRRRLAPALALTTALASPVAALFLALAGVTLALADERRKRAGGELALAALAGVLALALLFADGGSEPFVASAFWPGMAVLLGLAWLLPEDQRALRIGTLLYVAGCALAFVLDTPIGGNATRLASLAAGPVAALALMRTRPRALLVLAPALLWWQLYPTVRDIAGAAGDPSVKASYYAPLLTELSRRSAGAPVRVEIPFTARHWEAYHVARRVALARGWERQLDRERNGLFYGGRLSAERYRAWLLANGVQYVALADAALDDSARAEAALLRDGTVPGLREVARPGHWRVWQVSGASLSSAPAHVTGLGPDSVGLRFDRPGPALLRVRFTPYWAIVVGHGCVARGPGDMTRVSATASGPLTLAMRFTPARIGAGGPRCRR